MFASLFGSTTKSFEDYYNDLESAVAEVREEFSNADSDPGFKEAAAIFTEVAARCKYIEYQERSEAEETMKARSAILSKFGKEKCPHVTGEASKLLAQKYVALQQATVDQLYWPSSITQSVAYRLAFSTAKEKLETLIEILNGRIAEFDRSKVASLRP